MESAAVGVEKILLHEAGYGPSMAFRAVRTRVESALAADARRTPRPSSFRTSDPSRDQSLMGETLAVNVSGDALSGAGGIVT